MRHALAIAAMLAGMALAGTAQTQAAQGGVWFDCKALATGVANLADFRDAGARLELVLDMARVRSGVRSQAHWAAVEREIRRLWREELPAEKAAQRLYDRCMVQGGDMGMEG